MINNWDKSAVERAEKTWGSNFPPYTLDLFYFARFAGLSWLDLGCGFGRFLQFLTEAIDEPNYIGYDSSESMCSRIKERFPFYMLNIFNRDITEPIKHNQEVIISNAVLIHLPRQSQDKILDNIKLANPKAFAFDINSPSERQIDILKSKSSDHFERFINLDGKQFRMTWQSHYSMTEKLLKMFSNYTLTMKFHDLKNNNHKVLYMLERR